MTVNYVPGRVGGFAAALPRPMPPTAPCRARFERLAPLIGVVVVVGIAAALALLPVFV